MNADVPVLNRISQRTIGCALTVSNTLGCGFLEKVYENALAYKLRQAGLAVCQRAGVTVRYHRVIVGQSIADLLIEQANSWPTLGSVRLSSTISAVAQKNILQV